MRIRPSAPSQAGRPHLAFLVEEAVARGDRPWRRLALWALIVASAWLVLRHAIHAGGPVAWAAMVGLPIASACAGYGLGRASRRRSAWVRRDRDG